MPERPAAVIDTLRTARKGVDTGQTASTPARALEKMKSYVYDPGVFKRTRFLPASAYLRFFLSSNRVPERESSNQAYIVSR